MLGAIYRVIFKVLLIVKKREKKIAIIKNFNLQFYNYIITLYVP